MQFTMFIKSMQAIVITKCLADVNQVSQCNDAMYRKHSEMLRISSDEMKQIKNVLVATINDPPEGVKLL